MKQPFSFILLTARGVTGRVLLLLTAMVAVEAALAYRALRLLSSGRFNDLSGWAEAVPFAAGRYELMTALDISKMSTVFLFAGLLLCAILGTNFSSGRQGGQVSYTLYRLSISSRALIGWTAAYNALCFTILFGVQVILSLAFCRLALPQLDPALVNDQTLFTLFYHDIYLHNLLPLADIPRLVRNVLLVLAGSLSLSHASFGYYSQHSAASLMMGVWLILSYWSFASEPEDVISSASLILLLFLLIAACLILIWKEPFYELVASPKVPAGE